MPDFIKLPSERVEQLRALSKARNINMADLIAEYVNQQIALGNLPDTVPGIAVRRRGARVSIDFGDFQKSFDTEVAVAFAKGMRWLATPRARAMNTLLGEALEAFAGFATVGLSRHATSIKVSEGGKHRTLAPSIARDLARVIEKAAA